ncbi:FkbM family methyltransferase [Amycolatopsis sp. NPDC051128]|uniref:FkbM family methyltransferase n=1 Tax=Amycolatopsis sp. NPDC051128 TaxID=3155412 RepID=UPI00342A38C3
MKRRERCTVRYSAGEWVHRYRTGTVVQPHVGGASASLQDRDTRDAFLHAYRPEPGDTIIDLGAGVGSEARLLSSLVGRSGRVISVEAHPRMFDCLRRTIELNQLDNVTAVHRAITGVRGMAFIEDEPAYGGNGITTSTDNSLSVVGEPLGDLVDRLGIDRIDLLKMNIEGAELAVLESARELLPRVDNLVVSCHDFKADRGGADWQRTYGGVRALLVDAGYTVLNRPDDRRPWIPFYVYASR